MITDILIPFVAVSLAELGDKTQLSILLLSSKTQKRLHLLLGVMLAFLMVDGVAVLVGSWITNVVSINLLKALSGVVFIIFGLLMLRAAVTSEGNEVKSGNRLYFKNSFLTGFILIFAAEWGDKTQFASVLFASNYNALMVLIGTMTALTLLSVMAVFFGKIISTRVDKKVITKIGGIAFILMGISFFLF